MLPILPVGNLQGVVLQADSYAPIPGATARLVAAVRVPSSTDGLEISADFDHGLLVQSGNNAATLAKSVEATEADLLALGADAPAEVATRLTSKFDTAGFGPRDLSTDDALGGKIFWASTAEVRFPFPLVPETLGISGAVFADAGTLYDVGDIGSANPAVIVDESIIRSSVGFSILWASPIGPLRADFAQVLTAADYDKEEFFRFGASTKF